MLGYKRRQTVAFAAATTHTLESSKGILDSTQSWVHCGSVPIVECSKRGGSVLRAASGQEIVLWEILGHFARVDWSANGLRGG